MGEKYTQRCLLPLTANMRKSNYHATARFIPFGFAALAAILNSIEIGRGYFWGVKVNLLALTSKNWSMR